MYKKGFTFRAELPNYDNKNKAHICIIMNKHSDDDLYYVYMTSQDSYIKKHYDKYDPNGYVVLTELEVKEYFTNPVTSYIKCGINDIIEIKKEILITKIKNGTFEKVKDIPSSIIDKIENAIMDSVTYEMGAFNKISKII